MPMPGQLKSILRDGMGYQGYKTPSLVPTKCGGSKSINTKAFIFANP